MSLIDGSRHPAGVLERRINNRRSSNETGCHCSALISHARNPQKKSNVAAIYAKNQAGFDRAISNSRVCSSSVSGCPTGGLVFLSGL